MDRIQKAAILNDLEKKMVIIVGPRQAGKTWLSQDIAKSFERVIYLNYDNLDDRDIITEQSWLDSTELLILDELHKMPSWKNYLKGMYDTKPSSMRVIVTGSASLNIFNQMGDSLAGRYFRHHLMPISISELAQLGCVTDSDVDKLIERSGFPEPYLTENVIDANRWRMQYVNSLLSTDVFEFDKVHNLKAMRLVFDLLRKGVGSPVSNQSLAEDVGVSPTTIKKYIQILEALFIVFRVTPFSKNIARGIKKSPKIYFFDTGLVQGNQGAKFENLVANCLFKHVHAKIDYRAQPYSLHYLRTKEGQEIDFVLAEDDNMIQLIEVKLSDKNLRKTLLDFHQKHDCPAVQLVKTCRHERMEGDIKILKAINFLKELLL